MADFADELALNGADIVRELGSEGVVLRVAETDVYNNVTRTRAAGAPLGTATFTADFDGPAPARPGGGQRAGGSEQTRVRIPRADYDAAVAEESWNGPTSPPGRNAPADERGRFVWTVTLPPPYDTHPFTVVEAYALDRGAILELQCTRERAPAQAGGAE